MAITSYTVQRFGRNVRVSAQSDLSDPWFYWYLDGVFLSRTERGQFDFYVEVGEQVHVGVIDNASSQADPSAIAPASFPARRTLWWIRSLTGDVAIYRVEQRKDGGAWSAIGEVRHDDRRWDYRHTTEQLADLADYDWRIIPVDAAENDGTAITLPSERVVRFPDGPRFSATFDGGTLRVTFAAVV